VAVTLVGASTLIVGIAVRRWLPRAPYMIVAMFAGSLVAWLVEVLFQAKVPAVGALPASLPPLSMPDLSLDMIRDLAGGALAVTLLALTEAVSIARALALRSGQQIDGNQEFIGQGLSNLAGSFFSGYVATGSFNRSGLNLAAGAKSPLSAVFAGGLLMAIVLLVAPLAAYLPNAAMAGVLFLVAWGLIDFHHIGQILKASRTETAILATTFFATLFLNLEIAIMAGVMLSIAVYLSRTSRPRVVARVPDPHAPNRKFTTDPTLPECPQVKIVRIDGSLFFGAVNHVQECLRAFEEAQPLQKHVVIVASGINFVDIAGAEFLATEARRYRARDGGLYLIRAKPQVRETLAEGGYLDDIGAENLFESKTAAIAHIYARVEAAACRSCQHRIFRECGHEQASPHSQRLVAEPA
jgi:SulP family sulfate permease